MFDLDTWQPDDPGCKIEVAGVPPTEPAWWTAECACGARATSRTGPTVAAQLVAAKHRRAAA